jgi:hypothetical protein
MLAVRRRAPDGSFFHDGDRASGVFGVMATGFAVLLGLIVVLAFTSYDASRSGAENEALTVAQQFEVAQLMPPPARARLTGELVCYGRSVVHLEWPQMEEGTLADTMNRWGAALFTTLRRVHPRTASEQAAYGKWLDQRLEREAGRNARIHGAVGVIPAPLWIVLFLIAVLIFVYMLFFADSGERAKVQAMMMGSVVAIITATLLVIGFLDNPFKPGVGSLKPVAMERAVRNVEHQRAALGDRSPLPCDARGVPASAT